MLFTCKVSLLFSSILLLESIYINDVYLDTYRRAHTTITIIRASSLYILLICGKNNTRIKYNHNQPWDNGPMLLCCWNYLRCDNLRIACAQERQIVVGTFQTTLSSGLSISVCGLATEALHFYDEGSDDVRCSQGNSFKLSF